MLKPPVEPSQEDGLARSQTLGDLQLAVLDVLWERDEATVSEVQEALREERNPAKSTVATVLSRLERQGWVRHRRDEREFVYSPEVSRQQLRRSMVTDLVDRVFGGDPAELVTHLVAASEVREGDLDRLRELFDDLAPDQEAKS